MGASRRIKGRHRDQERRLVRHRIKAAGTDHGFSVRHGYDRSVTVAAVNDNEADIG